MKTKRQLLFLKSTGALVGELDKSVDSSFISTSEFLIKEVEMEEDGSEFWSGDYSTGEIISLAKRPIVRESELKYGANIKVLTKYPVHAQLNVIMSMLQQSDIPKTPEFLEMVAFIDMVKAELKEKIAVFSSNPDTYYWVSEADEQEETVKRSVR